MKSKKTFIVPIMLTLLISGCASEDKEISQTDSATETMVQEIDDNITPIDGEVSNQENNQVSMGKTMFLGEGEEPEEGNPRMDNDRPDDGEIFLPDGEKPDMPEEPAMGRGVPMEDGEHTELPSTIVPPIGEPTGGHNPEGISNTRDMGRETP